MANLTPYNTFVRLLFEAVESASAIQQQGIPAKLGFAPPDEPYQVQDADDANYVYVRFEAGQGPARGWARALNLGRVNPIDNLPVRVQMVGAEYQVLGPNGVEAALFDGGVGIGIGVGIHYHDFGPLFEGVSEHRLKPGLLTPYAPDGQTYTTRCFVEAFTYVIDGVRHHVERQPTVDLADRWPTSAGKRIVAVGYDTGAQAFVYANGAVVGSNLALGPGDLAAIALTGTGVVIPLDGVVLKYGATQIDKSTPFVRHGRPWLSGLIYDPATAQFNAAQLQGQAVHTAAPADGNGLVWNASESRWEPGAVSGGSIAASDGTTTVDPAALLDFDPDYFDVTDLGGGAAGVTFVGEGGGAASWSLELVENPALYPGSSSDLTSTDKSGISTSASSTRSGYPTSNAVDSNNSTYWNSNVNQANGMWFSFDFGKVIALTQISLYTNATNEFLGNFDVQASATGAWAGEEVTILAGQAATANGTKTLSFAVAPYRYWRFLLRAGKSYLARITELNFRTVAQLVVAGVPYGWTVTLLDAADGELAAQTQREAAMGACFFEDLTDVAKVQVTDQGDSLKYEDAAFSPTAYDLVRLKFW